MPTTPTEISVDAVGALAAAGILGIGTVALAYPPARALLGSLVVGAGPRMRSAVGAAVSEVGQRFALG